jgi:hypothetical protein
MGWKWPGEGGNQKSANRDGIRLFGITRDRPELQLEGSNPVGATRNIYMP